MWTDKIMGIIKRTLNRVVTIPGTSVGIIVWSTVFVNHPPNNNNNNHHHHMSADDLALEHFRQYLRIPSVHPDPDYGKYGDAPPTQRTTETTDRCRASPRPIKKNIVLVTLDA